MVTKRGMLEVQLLREIMYVLEPVCIILIHSGLEKSQNKFKHFLFAV